MPNITENRRTLALHVEIRDNYKHQKKNTQPHQNFTGPYKKALRHWIKFQISKISNVN